MIEPGHPRLSIARQCHLLGLSPFGFNYEESGENGLNLTLIRLIDEQFLETSWCGDDRWCATSDALFTTFGPNGYAD